ncbi:MAG: YdeI/OmpD-associated family protein [Cyanobacteria bacterium J06650_10]
MSKLDHYEQVEVTSRQQWRNWLATHYQQSESIWLVTYKKHTDKKYADSRYLAYDAIVEEALCFGWIDSLPRRLDEDRTMLLLSSRKPKSVWSKLNKERAAVLIKGGRMMPAGLAKIERAKADGSWTFLDDVEALIVPEDLTEALRENQAAKETFDGFNDSSKKGILQWLKMAKRQNTRQRRIEKIVSKAMVGEKAI